MAHSIRFDLFPSHLSEVNSTKHPLIALTVQHLQNALDYFVANLPEWDFSTYPTIAIAVRRDYIKQGVPMPRLIVQAPSTRSPQPAYAIALAQNLVTDHGEDYCIQQADQMLSFIRQQYQIAQVLQHAKDTMQPSFWGGSTGAPIAIEINTASVRVSEPSDHPRIKGQIPHILHRWDLYRPANQWCYTAFAPKSLISTLPHPETLTLNGDANPALQLHSTLQTAYASLVQSQLQC